MRSRARKEASAQEVREYYKQFAEAQHLEHRSWVDSEVFDPIDLRKVKSKNYVVKRWVLNIKTDKQGDFLKETARRISRDFHDKQQEYQQTDSPQDPDFGWVAKWQTVKVGTIFILISRQLSFKDSLIVWIVMLCVNCHQKHVILLILLQDRRTLHTAWMMLPRRWWNILDKTLCRYGMVPARADRYCYVLYSIQSRERTWKQNNSTQWHDTSNVSIKPCVRTEADAAFEKILDPIPGSPATGNSEVGIIYLFVDDLFGTGGTEMKQRVLARLRISKMVQKTGMMCSSQDKEFVEWRIHNQELRLVKKRLLRNWRRSLYNETRKKISTVSPAMHTRHSSLLGQINWLQSRTQFQCCHKFSGCASKAASPTIGDLKALNKLAATA